MPVDAMDLRKCVAALRALEGTDVAVRIVLRHRAEALVAVFHGSRQPLDSDRKQPSFFWPLGDPDDRAERSGIYLHEEDFVTAEQRAGGIVVVEQSSVIVNVRPLDERISN